MRRPPDNVSIPFHDLLLDELGSMFIMGTVLGSAFHFIKGIKNSPSSGGVGVRLSGGAQAVRMNAPRVGGRFAVWGGLLQTFHSAMEYARQKEDPWNEIFSFTATMGFLAMPRGIRASVRCAAVGGVSMVLIEGILIVHYRNEGVKDHELRNSDFGTD